MIRISECRVHKWIQTLDPEVKACLYCGTQNRSLPKPEPRLEHWSDHEKATGPSFIRR